MSEDLVVIKGARSTAKGKVTRNINYLKNILRCDKDGNFITADIDGDSVKEAMTELKSSYECFQDLNERVMTFREKLDDALAEADAIGKENLYESGVSEEYAAARTLVSKYKNTVKSEAKAKEEATRLSTLQVEVDMLKLIYDGKYSAAKIVVESTDDGVRKTASLVKIELDKAIKEYTQKLVEYKSALDLLEGESKFKPAGDCTTIVGEANEMILKLDSLAVSFTASSAPVTESVKIDHKNIVKLEKMSCPKFSGSPRDFAQWKREFNALVNVPGRTDVEIGGNLLHAVPQKHQRLINHLDLANHKEMMDVLSLEFGRSRLVVDDVVSQIEKIKPITTDKAFVEFVEILEKIKIDLTTLGKIQAVAKENFLIWRRSYQSISI